MDIVIKNKGITKSLKHLIVVLLTLITLSCKSTDEALEQNGKTVEVKKVSKVDSTKPGTPEIIRNYPINYRIHGDSMTIHRQYVSEWKIDLITNERLPLSYNTLPDIKLDLRRCGIPLSQSFEYNFAYRSSFLDSIHSEVDSLNHKMLEIGVLPEIKPVELILEKEIHFRSLHKLVFEPVLKDLECYGVEPVYPHIKNKYVAWKDLTLNIKEGRSATAVSVYFQNKAARLRVFSKDTTFDAELTKENAKLFMSFYDSESKKWPGNYGMGDTLGILVATNGEDISSDLMYETLSYFETDSLWFRFSFQRGNFKQSDTLDFFTHMQTKTYRGKPIIYLYPTETTDISVTVDPSVDFSFTYPHYPDSGWRVTAEPSGDLIDLSTGKKYYSLFWEGYSYYDCDFREGFVVSSKNVVSFLEEKLEILGLNFREAQEFILYWAPVLEQNEYSLIHFATDEYAEAVPLTINPEPDTEIRVLMNFKGVDSNYQIPEQQLRPVKRVGYTVVEWGGSNYETNGPIK